MGMPATAVLLEPGFCPGGIYFYKQVFSISKAFGEADYLGIFETFGLLIFFT